MRRYLTIILKPVAIGLYSVMILFMAAKVALGTFLLVLNHARATEYGIYFAD